MAWSWKEKERATNTHHHDQWNAYMAQSMRKLRDQTSGRTAREYDRRAREWDRKGGKK